MEEIFMEFGDKETRDEMAKLRRVNAELLEALKEIAEGKGRYSENQFEHARNTIEDMKELAKAAIAKAE